ncbi:MAG: hypothetical protein R3C68_19070, partial [Myxococcota bacterium]
MERIPGPSAALSRLSWFLSQVIAIAFSLSCSTASAEAERIVFDWAHAFASTPVIESLAYQVVGQVTDPRVKAERIYEAILALKHYGAIEGDRDNTPKARAPKSAAELLTIALTQGVLERRAGCYELAILYVAVARSVGLDALGIERVDPMGTGQIGHVMAAVRTEAQALLIFDLQSEQRRSLGAYRRLSDRELAAHHYNHAAIAAFLHEQAPQALMNIDRALVLAPFNASFVNNRASILAFEGDYPAAVAEATQAVNWSPAVPLYRYQLGRLLFNVGRFEAAAESLRAALALRPSYALA